MEILLWLVPPAVVTLGVMAWAGWMGRAGRGRVSRDEALRRMGEVLDREPVVSHAVTRTREPSTGVAARRQREMTADEPQGDDHVHEESGEPNREERRAS